MLKKIIIVIIGVLLSAGISLASDDLQVKVKVHKLIATDSENVIQGGHGLAVSLHKGRFFIKAGQDTMGMRWMGQSSPDLTIRNLSVGMSHKLGEYLTISASVGWYDPSFKEMDKPQPYPFSPFSEGLCRYLNKALIPDDGYPAWDWYSLKFQGAVGGDVNLDFAYPITKSIKFDLAVGYRFLKMNETIKGHDWSNGNDWEATNYWVIIRERDLGAYTVGATLTFTF